ncbi:MAG: macro domain-containing protein [Anaerolineales bacterium]|nr:macro domain-containing protein [Anaerolineales bacterium]
MNQIIAESTFASGQSLQIVQGDITIEEVDAIVNAANAQLQHGGGVAGAIVRRGGPQIQAESLVWVREHGPVSHEQPAYTTSGNLPCRFVIHAVGPVWGEGNEDTKLESAVTGSLRLAEQLGLSSLALPAISSGIFGFPKERAAEVILGAIERYYTQNPNSTIQQLRIVLLDTLTLGAFQKAHQRRVK